MEVEENLYGILRLEESGPQVQNAVIRKAYRKRALELHPDKRGDDPVAALDFQKLQKAYDILSDEKARASYDELQRVRKDRVEKESKQSEKRQKMMRDLAEKEKAHERELKVKAQEDDVQRQLKAEIARITKAHARKSKLPSSFNLGTQPPQESERFSTFDMLNSTGPSSHQFRESCFEAPEIRSSDSNSEVPDAERTLKVTWTCLEGGAGNYSATQLKKIFQEFGEVQDLVLRAVKSRKKRSALVVMATKLAADLATNNVCGEYSSPLLVVPLLPRI